MLLGCSMLMLGCVMYFWAGDWRLLRVRGKKGHVEVFQVISKKKKEKNEIDAEEEEEEKEEEKVGKEKMDEEDHKEEVGRKISKWK